MYVEAVSADVARELLLAVIKSDSSCIVQALQKGSREARRLLRQDLLQPWHEIDLPEHENKDAFVRSLRGEIDRAERNYCNTEEVRVNTHEVFCHCKNYDECVKSPWHSKGAELTLGYFSSFSFNRCWASQGRFEVD